MKLVISLMRRIELKCNDPREVLKILEKEIIGYLGIITPDNYPRVVPVNYCSLSTTIYFHGALEGEKFEVFRTKSKVTFIVASNYSTFPSHWISPKYACSSNTFYSSVLIKGTGDIVTDLNEKAVVLQTLMEKHQPEGGFEKIESNNKLYQKRLNDTGIFKIIPDQVDLKKKYGEYLPVSTREKIIEKLMERNLGYDKKTAEEIETTLQ